MARELVADRQKQEHAADASRWEQCPRCESWGSIPHIHECRPGVAA